jgi:ribonuclease HI
MLKKIPIQVYTDGGCKPNPGKGGWGWAEYGKIYNGLQIIFVDSGGEYISTNNRMELTAIIQYLKNAPTGLHYIINSDSQYSLKGLINGGISGRLEIPGVYTGRIKGWITKNFIGIKNEELWKELMTIIHIHLTKGSFLEFKYVKAHSGNPGNDLADILATIGINSLK